MSSMEKWNLIVNTITAIGTISASVIALWLGVRGSVKRLDCALMWDATTDDQPILIISNSSSKLIVIKEISVFYKFKNVGTYKMSEEWQSGYSSALLPNTFQTIKINSVFQLNLANCDDPNVNRPHYLCIMTKDIQGKRYYSHQKVSDNELHSLLFGKELLSESD